MGSDVPAIDRRIEVPTDRPGLRLIGQRHELSRTVIRSYYPKRHGSLAEIPAILRRSRDEIHRRAMPRVGVAIRRAARRSAFRSGGAETRHTIVDGGYTPKGGPLPGYQYPWPFTSTSTCSGDEPRPDSRPESALGGQLLSGFFAASWPRRRRLIGGRAADRGSGRRVRERRVRERLERVASVRSTPRSGFDFPALEPEGIDVALYLVEAQLRLLEQQRGPVFRLADDPLAFPLGLFLHVVRQPLRRQERVAQGLLALAVFLEDGSILASSWRRRSASRSVCS